MKPEEGVLSTPWGPQSHLSGGWGPPAPAAPGPHGSMRTRASPLQEAAGHPGAPQPLELGRICTEEQESPQKLQGQRRLPPRAGPRGGSCLIDAAQALKLCLTP